MRKQGLSFLTWQRYNIHDTVDTNILSSWLIPWLEIHMNVSASGPDILEDDRTRK
jgi:hypothetical protein